MRTVVQSPHCPSQVLFAFDDVALPGVERVRWASAYVTLRGAERLARRVAERIGSDAWESCEKRFVASLDFGLTDPSALKYLADLPNSEMRIAIPSVATCPGFFPGAAYHPKVYHFDEPKRTGYVVGSANLTESALLRNTEVINTGHDKPAVASWDEIWRELCRDTEPLSAALLADYRAHWRRPQRRKVETDAPPPTPQTTAASSDVFWNAIGSGAITPSACTHFWVQVEKVQGGSGNQVELPRGACRFFAPGAAVRYDASQSTIALLKLTFASRIWLDRKLTWHGNNRMERVNMPTELEGGQRYENSAVLFRPLRRRVRVRSGTVGRRLCPRLARSFGSVGHHLPLGYPEPSVVRPFLTKACIFPTGQSINLFAREPRLRRDQPRIKPRAVRRRRAVRRSSGGRWRSSPAPCDRGADARGSRRPLCRRTGNPRPDAHRGPP